MSRPRPSLLALFDPLSQPSPTVNRDTSTRSPDSGSDKENVNTTTPRNQRQNSKSLDPGSSETIFSQSTCSQINDKDQPKNVPLDSIGKSFSLGTNTDSSNLCLVQLAEELNSVCKITDETIDRGDGPRRPLGEISLTTNNIIATPNSCVEKLINLDTPKSTPRSVLKFATGVTKCELSTPITNVDSPPVVRCITPHEASPSIIVSSYSVLHPAPAIPFSSRSSVENLSPEISRIRGPQFHDPLSGFHNLSFEVQSSFEIKKIDLSGDLLNDEMLFLESLDDDSFADVPHPLSDRSVAEVNRAAHDWGSKSKRPFIGGTRLSLTKGELPPLDLSSDLEDDCDNMKPPSDILIQTPPRSPVATGSNTRTQVLAPKKATATLRGPPGDKNTGNSQALKTSVLKPRKSVGEVKPLVPKKKVPAPVPAITPTNTTQIRRSSLARRSSISIGTDLSRSKPTLDTSMTQTLSRTTGQRRLSMSTAPSVKAATVGRTSGARRAPLTSDASFFKEPRISESPERRNPSSTRTGLQRPSTFTSNHQRTGSSSLSRSTMAPPKPLPRPSPAPKTTIPRSLSLSSSTTTTSSRLSMSHTKSMGASKIPGPGTRKPL